MGKALRKRCRRIVCPDCGQDMHCAKGIMVAAAAEDRHALHALQPLAAALVKWSGVDGPLDDAGLEAHMAEGESELIEALGDDAIRAARWLAQLQFSDVADSD